MHDDNRSAGVKARSSTKMALSPLLKSKHVEFLMRFLISQWFLRVEAIFECTHCIVKKPVHKIKKDYEVEFHCFFIVLNILGMN